MENFINIFILSLVEGVTEFIPVSSTGHMLIVEHFMTLTMNNSDSFIIFIQLGAILGAVFIYPKRFIGLIPNRSNIPKVFFSKNELSYAHILAAILPVMIAGFFFYKTIRELLFNVYTVSFALIIGGLLMIVAEKTAKSVIKEVDQISVKQSFIIGLFQCLSLIPGMSRSASCIIGGLLSGVDLKPAVAFTFIIAVPVMVAAVGYELLKVYSQLALSDLYIFALGFFLSFVFAFLSMKIFLRVLSKVKLTPFAIYRIVIGIIVLLYVNP